MLSKWTRNGPTAFDSAANYMGEDLSDLYVVPVSQNRDSGPLARSNFRTTLDMLGGESDDVRVHRFGHWACGWYELILITGGSPAYSAAENIARKLDNYPILDESDYSGLCLEEQAKTWRTFTLADRVQACARHGLSIFAARRDGVPENDGDLDQYLTGDE